MLSREGIIQVVESVKFQDWEFRVTEMNELLFLQIVFQDLDVVSKKLEPQYCRKWLLPDTTVSDVVRTCFKAVQAAMEHELCEHFKYLGKSIYNPHISVEALHESIASKRFDLPTDT